ncbi:MAG: hypothetical protein K2N71_10260 [Oscillospiraceae bacterium]|nr:hypothetical protein [Oscillospiraceae bacterium]
MTINIKLIGKRQEFTVNRFLLLASDFLASVRQMGLGTFPLFSRDIK